VVFCFVAVAVAFPIALVFADLLVGPDGVPRSLYGIVVGIATPIALLAGLAIARYHVITIDQHEAIFAFTRYALPKTKRAAYREILDARYIPGIFGFDNRPRPLFEFELRSGESFWIPLSVYQNRQINEMLEALRARGINLQEVRTKREP
jgi:hypothetical protein